jgi:hypothetical protein
MQAIAAALVSLAGAVLGAGGAVAQAVPAAHGGSSHGEGIIALLGGGLLIFVGLCLLLFGWAATDCRRTFAPFGPRRI